MDVLSPQLQYGAFGLALVVLVILAMVVRTLLRMVSNDLNHVEQRLENIQTLLGELPCRKGESCPEEKDK